VGVLVGVFGEAGAVIEPQRSRASSALDGGLGSARPMATRPRKRRSAVKAVGVGDGSRRCNGVGSRARRSAASCGRSRAALRREDAGRIAIVGRAVGDGTEVHRVRRSPAWLAAGSRLVADNIVGAERHIRAERRLRQEQRHRDRGPPARAGR
jgi:hypothetical protein